MTAVTWLRVVCGDRVLLRRHPAWLLLTGRTMMTTSVLSRGGRLAWVGLRLRAGRRGAPSRRLLRCATVRARCRCSTATTCWWHGPGLGARRLARAGIFSSAKRWLLAEMRRRLLTRLAELRGRRLAILRRRWLLTVLWWLLAVLRWWVMAMLGRRLLTELRRWLLRRLAEMRRRLLTRLAELRGRRLAILRRRWLLAVLRWLLSILWRRLLAVLRWWLLPVLLWRIALIRSDTLLLSHGPGWHLSTRALGCSGRSRRLLGIGLALSFSP